MERIGQVFWYAAQTLIAILVGMTVSIFDPVLAAPGDIDSTFFTGALPTLPMPGSGSSFPPIYVGAVLAVAVQPDGKILAAVNVIACGTEPLALGCLPAYAAVIRYNGDGSIDSGFGSGGIATTPLNQGDSLNAFLLQSDGSIVLGTAGFPVAASVMRFMTTGRLDSTFGTQGIVPLSSIPSAIAEQADGKLLVATSSLGMSSNTSSILRLNADGSIDSSYGQSGMAPLALPLYYNGEYFPQAFMAVQPTGELLIAAASGPTSGPPAAGPPVSVFVERLTADGAPDASFGNGSGVAPIAFTNTPQQFLATAAPVGIFLQPSGEVLIAGMQNAPTDQIGQFALVQLAANGTYDLTFGSGGRLIAAAPAYLNSVNAVQQSDGKVLFSGMYVTSYGNSLQVLARLDPGASPDPGFGNCGQAKLAAVPYSGFDPAPLALQPNGSVVVANPVQDPVLLRVLGGSGTAVSAASDTNPAPLGLPINLSAIVAGGATLTGTFTITDFEAPIAGCTSLTAALPDCLVVLAEGVHEIVATYSGDAQNPPASSCPLTQYVDPAGLTTAVEYLHAVFNDYFITNDPTEVQALDASLVWHRTGDHFFVYPLDQLDGSAPVCRFWSGQTYAPQSTHFFTSDAAECATLMQSTVWIYEGTVFGLTPPSAAGDCAPGTEPLYRLYNNGQGGAPNHRYLTNSAQWGMMIKFYGWIPEGSGVGVIGCV